MKEALILLVEDNEMDVELTMDAFRENRLVNHIEVAHDGEEALAYLLGKGDFADRLRHPLPDIILLDLKMPKVDGFEVLKIVKSTPTIKRIPTIILTSSKDEGDRIMGYDSGANSYLVKPVSFDGFLDIVKQVTIYWLTLNVPSPME
ncbi:MAG: response regulator [Candidatus Cloacimonetes bacterium]|nr:response regulator [Candidatus Cloacimonadota bacterium]